MQILLGEVKMADVQLPRLQRGMANQRAAPYPVSGEISDPWMESTYYIATNVEGDNTIRIRWYI